MSIKIYLLPADNFLEIIDAINWASGSTLRSLSTLINLSSAGAKPRDPPQAKQAFVFFTTDFNSSRDKSTFATVSITSAVPEADVMAREEVFGITMPATAQIETTMGVVLFPGIPPIQCLSAILFESHLIFFPVLDIAS